MRIVMAISLLALTLTTPADAQILGNPAIQGDAVGDVEWVCNQCCKITNNGPKNVKATLAVSLASITMIVRPGQTKNFDFGGTCMTGGFGIVVNRTDEQQ